MKPAVLRMDRRDTLVEPERSDVAPFVGCQPVRCYVVCPRGVVHRRKSGFVKLLHSTKSSRVERTPVGLVDVVCGVRCDPAGLPIVRPIGKVVIGRRRIVLDLCGYMGHAKGGLSVLETGKILHDLVAFLFAVVARGLPRVNPDRPSVVGPIGAPGSALEQRGHAPELQIPGGPRSLRRVGFRIVEHVYVIDDDVARLADNRHKLRLAVPTYRGDCV